MADDALDTAATTVTLASETDFAGFRHAARGLLARGLAPDAVQWAVAGAAAPGLFEPGAETTRSAEREKRAGPVEAIAAHAGPAADIEPAETADGAETEETEETEKTEKATQTAQTAGSAASTSIAASAAITPGTPGTTTADHADAGDAAPAAANAVRVSPAFIALCEEVVLHSEPTRFALLYRLLWRLQREPGLRDDPLDADMAEARLLAQAVRRDLHKMKAFVRFREVAQGPGEPTLHVAWFEPQHHIVEAVSGFFQRRFTAMQWAILTPDKCVRWDGAALAFTPGARREDAPPADAGEALWLTYYRSIFNPARLKLRAMENEMPRRYWRNLPEAELISGLAAQSAERTSTMVQAPTTTPRRRIPVAAVTSVAAVAEAPAHASAAPPLPPADAATGERAQAWEQQRTAAANCRECPLGALATQTVWGDGPVGARLMLVGEQPGDQEDLQGRPFVGPAGQLLARAMAELGWPRQEVYITNAVKHFKYEPRGKRRLHKTPAQKEADACRHWLESEIALVQPGALLALGATAARQLMGRAVAVTRERGQWLLRDDGRRVLITLHPSALLRTEPDQRDAAYAAWLADLRLADIAPAI